jgi:hypothetical protein
VKALFWRAALGGVCGIRIGDRDLLARIGFQLIGRQSDTRADEPKAVHARLSR